MEWRSPEAFFLVIFLLAAVFWIFFNRKKMTAVLQFGSTQVLRLLPRGLKTRLVHLPLILKSLALILLLAALARPQQPNTKIKKILKVSILSLPLIFQIPC